MPKNDVHAVYRKSVFIANDLRSQIVEGAYAPGDHLPSRDHLAAHYDVGKATIQRAFDQLKRDGFAVAKVGSGTIVSTSSPHLTRYALLFPQGRNTTGYNQLWYAMEQEARALVDDCNVDLHYGFDGQQGITRFQGLLEDVSRHRLAGLIFASPPHALAGTPLLTQAGVARAAFMAPSPDFAFPSVCVKHDELIAKIAHEVLRHGCQRVALIASDLQTPASVHRDQDALQRLGVPIHADWVHGVSNIRPAWGANLIRLIMSGPADTRPDCLIVLDDNLLPAIGQELKESNLIPPRDLQLIAHCNFPWLTPSAVPATRIGYCITECLRGLVQLINDQQQGRPHARTISLSPYHESEYPRPPKPKHPRKDDVDGRNPNPTDATTLVAIHPD